MCDTGIFLQINMAACAAVVLPVHVEDDHWAAVGVCPSLSSIIVANSIDGCTGHLREDVNMLAEYDTWQVCMHHLSHQRTSLQNIMRSRVAVPRAPSKSTTATTPLK